MNAPRNLDPRLGQYPPYGYGPGRGVDDVTLRIPQYQPPPAAAQPPKKRRRWPWVVGGLVVLGILGSAPNSDDQSVPAPASAAGGAAIPAVDVPDAAATESPAVAPAAPAPAPAPAAVAPPAPAVPPEPQLSVSQENALRSAESYLDYSGFSRSGLIGQLEYEGFPTDDATFAVDNVTVDWMVQAERSAASYMDFSSFSRSGLIDQLQYEGFTSEQAEHGANSVGL